MLARSRDPGLSMPPRHPSERTKVLYNARWGRSGSTIVANILGQLDGPVSVGELVYIWERGFAENRGAARLLRLWGYRGRLEVFPEVGVDTELFSPPRRSTEERPFAIGFVGRLVHEKGADLVLAAAKILFERGHSCRVVVCGVGPEERALRRQSHSLGIMRLVTWLGEYEYEAVPQAIGEMDVLVLPSRSVDGKWTEQFGHVLIEAMAMGVPVIGSTSGAIPDVIGRDLGENDGGA